jgi:hypothetical protein
VTKKPRGKRPKYKCLTCINQAEVRGLCRRCYQSALSAIRRGEHDEAELIAAGLLGPNRKGRISAWTLQAEQVLEPKLPTRKGSDQ